MSAINHQLKKDKQLTNILYGTVSKTKINRIWIAFSIDVFSKEKDWKLNLKLNSAFPLILIKHKKKVFLFLILISQLKHFSEDVIKSVTDSALIWTLEFFQYYFFWEQYCLLSAKYLSTFYDFPNSIPSHSSSFQCSAMYVWKIPLLNTHNSQNIFLSFCPLSPFIWCLHLQVHPNFNRTGNYLQLSVMERF